MKPKRLLAKSSTTPDEPRAAEQLRGHTALVIAAAKQLLQHRGADALAAAGLDAPHRARLERWVLTAAFAHDLGKCSDHFQQTVRRRRDRPQLVRHEACSLYLAWPGQPLGKWLGAAVESERDLRLALLAAAGHHRKFLRRAIAPDDSGAGIELTLWSGHEDFVSTLRLGSSTLILPEPPSVADVRIEHGRRSALAGFFARCEEEVEDLRPTDLERALLAITKALVLDADVAGSALPRGREKPAWIGEVLSRPRHGEALEQLVGQRLEGQPLRPFQSRVAACTSPVTLVRAGCGSGKTAAAYAWAARAHPGRSVWVTYPTTGTATEGFRDYVHQAPVRGRLDHGRALVDLEIFGLEDDDEGQRALDRLDALRGWDMDVVTCTVDTVLGLVQNQRKGLYAFASLCHAAVVFDEIHAYDDALFGALLRFLRALPGVPALLMTASLPGPRLRALAELVTEVHGRPLEIIDGPADLETLPRYRRSQREAEEELRDVLARDGKVLWVSNSVDRCIGAAARAPVEAYVYHSRFRYEDRVARHGDVIDAFKRPGAAVAATTQVAEMSLDLSADLLITDLAPIPALIQRLGRLNRRSHPASPRPVAPFVIVEPDMDLPYAPAELAEAREWLARLGTGALSQRALVEAWVEATASAPAPTRSAWLDGVFHTEPAAVRDATPGITVIRAEDAARCRAEAGAATRLALPMSPPPRALAWRSWPRAAQVYPVAPEGSIHYNPLRGARWHVPG